MLGTNLLCICHQLAVCVYLKINFLLLCKDQNLKSCLGIFSAVWLLWDLSMAFGPLYLGSSLDCSSLDSGKQNQNTSVTIPNLYPDKSDLLNIFQIPVEKLILGEASAHLSCREMPGLPWRVDEGVTLPLYCSLLNARHLATLQPVKKFKLHFICDVVFINCYDVNRDSSFPFFFFLNKNGCFCKWDW